MSSIFDPNHGEEVARSFDGSHEEAAANVKVNLAILDYDNQRPYIYWNVPYGIGEDDLLQFIIDQGHDLDNCEWFEFKYAPIMKDMDNG